MVFARSSLANHANQALRGRTTDQGVIDDDHPLAMDDVPNRVELDSGLLGSSRLPWTDERAANVVVPDEAVLEFDPTFVCVPEGHGI